MSFALSVADTDMGTKPRSSLKTVALKQTQTEDNLPSLPGMPNSIIKHPLEKSIKYLFLLQIAPKHFPNGFWNQSCAFFFYIFKCFQSRLKFVVIDTGFGFSNITTHVTFSPDFKSFVVSLISKALDFIF